MFDVCMHARGSPLPYEFKACDLSKRFDLCSHTTLLEGRLGRRILGQLSSPMKSKAGVDRFQHGLDRLSVFDQH
jgi:hypothetical protein